MTGMTERMGESETRAWVTVHWEATGTDAVYDCGHDREYQLAWWVEAGGKGLICEVAWDGVACSAQGPDDAGPQTLFEIERPLRYARTIDGVSSASVPRVQPLQLAFEFPDVAGIVEELVASAVEQSEEDKQRVLSAVQLMQTLMRRIWGRRAAARAIRDRALLNVVECHRRGEPVSKLLDADEARALARTNSRLSPDTRFRRLARAGSQRTLGSPAAGSARRPPTTLLLQRANSSQGRGFVSRARSLAPDDSSGPQCPPPSAPVGLRVMSPLDALRAAAPHSPLASADRSQHSPRVQGPRGALSEMLERDGMREEASFRRTSGSQKLEAGSIAPGGRGWQVARRLVMARAATAVMAQAIASPCTPRPGEEERKLIGKRELERSFSEGSLQRRVLELFSRLQAHSLRRQEKRGRMKNVGSSKDELQASDEEEWFDENLPVAGEGDADLELGHGDLRRIPAGARARVMGAISTLRSARATPWDKTRACEDVAQLCRLGDEEQRGVCQDELHRHDGVWFLVLSLIGQAYEGHEDVSEALREAIDAFLPANKRKIDWTNARNSLVYREAWSRRMRRSAVSALAALTLRNRATSATFVRCGGVQIAAALLSHEDEDIDASQLTRTEFAKGLYCLLNNVACSYPPTARIVAQTAPSLLTAALSAFPKPQRSPHQNLQSPNVQSRSAQGRSEVQSPQGSRDGGPSRRSQVGSPLPSRSQGRRDSPRVISGQLCGEDEAGPEVARGKREADAQELSRLHTLMGAAALALASTLAQMHPHARAVLQRLSAIDRLWPGVVGSWEMAGAMDVAQPGDPHSPMVQMAAVCASLALPWPAEINESFPDINAGISPWEAEGEEIEAGYKTRGEDENDEEQDPEQVAAREFELEQAEQVRRWRTMNGQDKRVEVVAEVLLASLAGEVEAAHTAEAGDWVERLEELGGMSADRDIATPGSMRRALRRSVSRGLTEARLGEFVGELRPLTTATDLSRSILSYTGRGGRRTAKYSSPESKLHDGSLRAEPGQRVLTASRVRGTGQSKEEAPASEELIDHLDRGWQLAAALRRMAAHSGARHTMSTPQSLALLASVIREGLLGWGATRELVETLWLLVLRKDIPPLTSVARRMEAPATAAATAGSGRATVGWRSVLDLRVARAIAASGDSGVDAALEALVAGEMPAYVEPHCLESWKSCGRVATAPDRQVFSPGAPQSPLAQDGLGSGVPPQSAGEGGRQSSRGGRLRRAAQAVANVAGISKSFRHDDSRQALRHSGTGDHPGRHGARRAAGAHAPGRNARAGPGAAPSRGRLAPLGDGARPALAGWPRHCRRRQLRRRDAARGGRRGPHLRGRSGAAAPCGQALSPRRARRRQLPLLGAAAAPAPGSAPRHCVLRHGGPAGHRERARTR